MLNCPNIFQRKFMKGNSKHANLLSKKKTGRKHIIREKRLTMNLITNSINVLTHMHTDKNIFNEKCKKLQHLEHTFKCLMLISSVVPTKCWSSKIMHFTSSFSSTWRYNLNSVDREIPIFFFKKHAENLSFFYATYN